jgi:hypothetical protein
MSENFTNTSSVKTNTFNKGMVKDNTEIYMSEGLWTNAINAINNSHYGESGSIGNEPSNRLCASAPYTIIGFANISQTRWVIFSTNDTDSEIGIFDESDCTYTLTVNDPCLGFKRTHLITAVVKGNYDCTDSAYFADNLNPDRVLNLNRVPYKVIGDANPDPDCYEPEYSTDLDCDALRLHPLVDQPCVSVIKSQGAGQLNNGSYMAVVAYSENGVRLTDYSIPSVPQPLWDHTGIGGSLEVTVDKLDQNFEEYELVIIATVNQQTIAKKIGYYSIRQKTVTVDLFQQSLITVDIAQIPLRSIVYEKSEKLFDVNGYLIRSGVTTQPYFNYQELANKIKSQWVAVEYPVDYYWGSGNKTGYMRDEIYSFFIRWVYKTGARSASFHIPGRTANLLDVQPVATSDVLYPNETQVWQVYDTATKFISTGTLPDGGVIIEKGDMAYWESTERYPDDRESVWGELCGKPIRHHKMPSNETTHIHNQGGDKIVLLGVEFSNIEHPVDENGQPVVDVVGYEILRGSREGNRSIVAKGMFNNMLEYNLPGNTTKKGLIQNYPYNDLRPDNFLTDDFTVLDSGSGSPGNIEETSKLDKYKNNIFSFHSVETSFVKPYLGTNHIKIYTEERGVVNGKFEFPHKHPKHIIITNGAFISAGLVGIGIAAVASIGKTTVTGGQYPLVAATGSPFGSATRESGTGTITTDLLGTNVLQTSSGFGAIGVAGTAAGIVALGASYAYYWGQGLDQALEVIRNFSKPRQYMIQYNSHGFYSDYSNVSNSSVPIGLAQSFRRAVSDSGAKYIGSGLHDLDATFRINNLNRNKYVALKLEGTVPNPSSSVDKTKHRIKDGGVTYAEPTKNVVSNDTVAYYGAVKVDFQNQYGQLSSIVQLPTDSCVYNTVPQLGTKNTTGVLFGGDVYINRYTEKNPYMFFNTWMFDMPEKTEYDYRNYVNGPAPRYWTNFEKFDGQDFNISILPNGANGPLIDFTTPSDQHRLDRPSSVTGLLVVKNSYAYLFHNGVRDFFTESELNMAFRDYGENDFEKFYDVYGNSFSDESTMFRSDLITKPIYYKYDLSLSSSKLFNNFASWGSILPRDYDPRLYSTCFEYFPNRAIYSLQQQDGLKRDNWRNFLPLNYKDFSGKINTIKNLNATGAMILFENAEPLMFVGVDQLQTQGGVKVSIGDGGLFQGNTQALVNADDTIGYASSISSRAAVNTPFGLFFVSQQSGKIMQNAGGIQEISRNGMKHWFNENLPSKMLEQYPDFPLYDNPVVGIGVQAIYDPQYELVYFTKRDYVPLREDLFFDAPNGIPYYICGNTGGEVLPPSCVARATGRISSSTFSESGITLSWIPPALLSGEDQPTSYKIVFEVELTPGVFTALGTPSEVTLAGNVLSNSYPMLLDYDGGTHSLNTSDVYRITVTTVYDCGEIEAYVTGTLAQITAGTAPMTYPDGEALVPMSPMMDITPSSEEEYCTAPIDIAFVLDITPSMNTTINNLRTGIINIADDAIAKSNNNYRFGLITVDEETDGPAVNVVRQMFTVNNVDDLEDALASLPTIGGGGEPEPTDLAIDSVLDGILGTFRPNAIKMIIMMTDALPSGGNDAYEPLIEIPAVQAIADKAFNMGVYIYPIATGTGYNNQDILDIHDIYANTTGGVSNVSQTGLIESIVSEEILNAPCPPTILKCLISASVTRINVGQSSTLTWDAGDAVTTTITGIGAVASTGTRVVSPTVTTTYTLITTGPDGLGFSCSVTIVVVPVTSVKCPCAFDDPRCFTPCNWTISYDPKNKQWISFHDWKPTLVMPSYKHFFTINGDSLWRHNDRWDDFCNYYGVDYPWEVEFPVVTPNNITTLRSIEYTLDVYKFFNDGKDFHHILDENFDRAVLYNSEQISGLLRLRLKGKNAPLDLVNYPQLSANGIDILYSKEENKFRFNQFWDITRDRSEFNTARIPMFNTRCAGYQKDINPNYIDYFKSTLERKKFRHYGNSIILRKNLSEDKKFILKLSNTKQLNSSR